MEYTINVNKGYRLVGAMPDQPRRLAFVAARSGSLVTLLMIGSVETCQLANFDGHEFGRVTTPHGVYNLSPAGEVTDMGEVAEVCDIIRNAPEN